MKKLLNCKIFYRYYVSRCLTKLYMAPLWFYGNIEVFFDISIFLQCAGLAVESSRIAIREFYLTAIISSGYISFQLRCKVDIIFANRKTYDRNNKRLPCKKVGVCDFILLESIELLRAACKNYICRH
jgi:hypothetical protein